MKILKKIVLSLLFLAIPLLSFAQDAEAKLNSGDTAWMLIATALVMLMTPAGLALFYGGLSNKRNVINTVGMSYVAFIMGSMVWVIAGYSIAFGGANPIWGGMKHFMLMGIGVDDVYPGTAIPTLLFVCFQGVFAAIAVAIISGSLIERIKFSTWMIFSALWVLLIYAPLVHWVWGEGLLSSIGELDFAGGTVIHVNAGVAGLVAALLLGKRKNGDLGENKPSSLKLTLLGSALLWFGWFGFNGGSQVAADGIAANAFLVTNIAACAGGFGWMLFEWTKQRPSLLGISSGVISGLVGITPASGYVDVTGALMIGLSSGIVGYFGVMKLKSWLKYDDTLDAFGIHGLVGIWGSIATGIFANPAINADASGLLYGNSWQVVAQTIAVLVTILFSAAGTALVFWISSLMTRGGRVDEAIEEKGMDHAYHGESSFASLEAEVLHP